MIHNTDSSNGGGGSIVWTPIPLDALANVPVTRAPPSGARVPISIHVENEHFIVLLRLENEYGMAIMRESAAADAGTTIAYSNISYDEETMTSSCVLVYAEGMVPSSIEYAIIYYLQ